MKAFVISLGGSLIVPDQIDTKFLREFKSLILRHSKTNRFIIICGGGKTARRYQTAVKEVNGPTQEDLDWIGIHTTRLNGHLMRTIFKEIAYPRVIKNPHEKVRLKPSERVIIAAGWQPGCSTDYDAVLMAKTHEIKSLINLSNIDYVYDKDPSKFKDAKPLKQVSWKDFRKVVGDVWDPGLNAPFDPIASKLAQRLKLKVVIANGKNLKNLDAILRGKKFIGTTIS